MKKAGAVAGALLVLGTFVKGVWSLTEPMLGTPPYASKMIEIVVAGLQIDSLRAKEAHNRYQIFQLEDEKRRDGQRFPRWKEDLLQRIRFEQQQLERDIKRLEGR